MYGDDLAIVGGLARLDGRPVMLIGHQKGRDTKERVRRNYGMPKPEGYRKALRLMKLAERFRLPLITFIDTPGAYPGVGSEERNQSEAIARNLFEMATLRVPVISVGDRRGRLGRRARDRRLRPAADAAVQRLLGDLARRAARRSCGRARTRRKLAADAMGITAERLDKLGLVDEVLKRAARRRAPRSAGRWPTTLQAALLRHLHEVDALARGATARARATTRCARYGVFRRRMSRRGMARPPALRARRSKAALAMRCAHRPRGAALCVALQRRPRLAPCCCSALRACAQAGTLAAAARDARRSRPAAGRRGLGGTVPALRATGLGVPLVQVSVRRAAGAGREPGSGGARGALRGAGRQPARPAKCC